MMSLLQKLVKMESPTSEKEAVDALGSFLRERLVELGAQVEVAEQAERGNHLLARVGGGGSASPYLVPHGHGLAHWDLKAAPFSEGWGYCSRARHIRYEGRHCRSPLRYERDQGDGMSP